MLFLICQAMLTPVCRAQSERTFVALRHSGVMTMGAPVNSPFPESSPVLSPDGRTLYFTRDDHPQNFGLANAGDIWVSFRQDNGNWSRAINAGAPLNDGRCNAVAALNPAGTRIYLTSEADSTTLHQPLLSVAARAGRSWATPEPVSIPDYRNYRPERYFFPSADERVLLFSADVDSSGSMDLYFSLRLPDGGWDAPRSLGPNLNSPGDERRLVLAADDRTLYFSSNGHESHGGTDIFMSRRLDDSWMHWSPPVNLGSIVNTPDDDDEFSLAAAGTFLLFVRESAEGTRDIFRAALPLALRPMAVVLVQGRVNGAGAGKRLFFVRHDQSPPRPEPVIMRGDGTYRFIVPAGTNAITLYLESDKGFAESRCLTLAGPSPVQPDTDLPPLLEALHDQPVYQQRENELKLLQQQLDRIGDLLTECRRQIDYYTQLSAGTLPPLDTSCFDSLRVRRLEPAYFACLAAAPTVVPALPVLPLSPADRRLADLRRRLREKQGLEPEERKAAGPLAFAAFRRMVWDDLVGDLLPGVKQELERELIVERLAALALAKRPDAFVQSVLEERLAALGKADHLPVEAPTGESPLEQLEEELRQVLRDGALESLYSVLHQLASVDIDERLRYRRLALHEANLQQALDGKLGEQMALEQQLLAGLPPPTDTVAAQPVSITGGLPVTFREIQTDLTLLPVQTGRPLRLNGVFYTDGGGSLLPLAEVELRRLLTCLQRNPRLGVLLTAHTHGALSHLRARTLTEARARTAADFLLANGIEPHRVRWRGAGKLQPLTDEETDQARRENQRLEIEFFLPESLP